MAGTTARPILPRPVVTALLAVCSTLVLVAGPVCADAVPVALVEAAPGRWELQRGGAPWFIQGAGGDGPKDLLAASGANTFRTWGVGPDLGRQLDEAQRLGLAVVVGHWLGHERHGFDYHDAASLAQQRERVRSDVLAYLDHPAVLLWAVGNEMEGFAAGDDPAIWAHVQDIAAMIKELDPHHPVMTVTAEIGGGRVRAVHALCPSIDIMGINSYGGLPSVPARYRELGGTKPIIITEFGPPGVWEIGLTPYGAPPELTSTAKAAIYRDAYTAGCLQAQGLCLGGFAFTWGAKLEATATWYCMFLPTGEKLGAVDAMTEVWSGHPPRDLCPEIRSFRTAGPDIVQPGDTVHVELEVVDPEGAAVDARWSVLTEVSEYLTGGDVPPAPLELEGIVRDASQRGATLVMPGGGLYRLYLTVRDGTGGAATASVPLKVEGPPGGTRIKLPLAVYADGAPQPWVASGWMGGTDALALDPASTVQPRSGPTCLEVRYDAPGMWVGVAWQHPANDWGDLPGGYDLTGARRLTFWARGAEGGEKLDFGVGLLGRDRRHGDSVRVERKGVKLKREWKQYSIDLEGQDLTRIKTPFVWSLAGRGRPLTFYLDDVLFEP
ncbi:MAG: hypothetical protein IPK64_04825 [bacterium]|nr:hypothetical protein [bacterium]